MPLLLFILISSSQMLYAGWKLRKDLHILQLNSYRNDRYCEWIKKNPRRAFSIYNFFFLCTLIPLMIGDKSLAAWILIGSYLIAFFLRRKIIEKKPFVFTPRARRLYALCLILLFFTTFGLFAFSWHKTIPYLVFAFAASSLLIFFSPIFLLICNSIIYPLEIAIMRWYFNDAKKLLSRMPNLKIIGITGSFGKTSTKHILYELLRDKYNTLMPPGSFNTPMGITKTIRSALQPLHEIFIVEMSAKQRGDIKEICDLVKPQFGLLTSIGEQHLETFGSLENIKKTKNELIESLPEDGLAFFNIDDSCCEALSHLTKRQRVYYGISGEKADYRATNIKIEAGGSSFVVCGRNGDLVNLQTKLLGMQNVYNILAAVAIAGELGVKLSEMVYPIKRLKPVPHRLELKKFADDIIYIDDAFNSNPVGSKMALEVLQQIQGRRKIIVTPGMIELGEIEYDTNRQFGEYIAEVCDHVILVGKKQALPIEEGLKRKNFSASACYIAEDFNDANRHLRSILQAHDVVLFENDLPDNY